MSLTTDRVVFNRVLNAEEYLSISFFMIGFMSKYQDEDLYYYVEVHESLDINITTYRAEEVQWQAKELFCTDHEAVICINEFEGFYENTMELLWREGINDLNRYIAQTSHTLEHDEDPFWCVAKDETEAYYYFSEILQLEDIITIREDNEETL